MRLNPYKDFDTVVRVSVEERDNLITKLYSEGKKYYYTDKQSDGKCIVAYNKE